MSTKLLGPGIQVKPEDLSAEAELTFGAMWKRIEELEYRLDDCMRNEAKAWQNYRRERSDHEQTKRNYRRKKRDRA